MTETETVSTALAGTDGQNPFWFGNGLSFLDKALASIGSQESISLQDRLIIVAGESGTLKSRLSYGFLASGMTDAEAGAILLTSEGMQFNDLLHAFGDWGRKLDNSPEPKQSQVMVRQVPPRFISSSGFVFCLRTCIREMKKRLNLLQRPPKDSWRLRIVIDNWNSIVDAHETLQRDRQFLHAVHKVLREEGVLALIVATQLGSPAHVAKTERVHDVTGLEASRILTWRVNFFGDRRIAITTSLPSTKGMRSAVGELVRVDGTRSKVQILENFDAYEDLELGAPRRVELKVRLYSGHDEVAGRHKSGSSAYNHEVSALFGDLFASQGSVGDVVTLENTSEYDAFKEYIQNLESGPRKETLVFQVDEFWTGATDTEGGKKEGNDNKPFARVKLPQSGDEDGRWDVEAFPDSTFSNQVDRVPLHKDFGMILADRAAWFQARNVEIEGYLVVDGLPFCGRALDLTSILAPSNEADCDKLRNLFNDYSLQSQLIGDELKHRRDGNSVIRVGHVWNSLCLTQSERFRDGSANEFALKGSSGYRTGFAPSWGLFLSACQAVAEQQGKTAFDLDFRTSETLSSFVLEVWFSKILDQAVWSSLGQSPNDILASRFTELPDLRELVHKYPRELDYAVRLAAKVLSDRYRKSPVEYGGPSNSAVAFRTWYATGVLCQSERSGLTPLRVPARTCVRGDWYLAVGRGSRSLQLGESAIEKLVTRSMNSRRLREGVGLPVRSVDNLQYVESAMTSPDPLLGTDRRVRYRDIHSVRPVRFDQREGEFMPRSTALFRSRISGYDQRASDFFRMLLELLRLVRPLTFEKIMEEVGSSSPASDPYRWGGGNEEQEQQVKAVYDHFAPGIPWPA